MCPNNCYGGAKIVGSKKDIATVKGYLKVEAETNGLKSYSFFNNFFPVPNGEDWYSRCVANWGTKRDLCDLEIIQDCPDTVELFYWTAWSPPLGAFVKLSELHPEITIHLNRDESGMGFSGEATISHGQISLIDEYDDDWDENTPTICTYCADHPKALSDNKSP